MIDIAIGALLSQNSCELLSRPRDASIITYKLVVYETNSINLFMVSRKVHELGLKNST